ncbi:MAG: hypothetical protein JXQ89_19455 [Pelagimonas sp.]
MKKKLAGTDLERQPTTEFWIRLIGILGCLAGIVFVATIFRASILAEKENGLSGTLGTGVFGDAFGFATSMFTGLAFVGLVITMRLQRQELASTNHALSIQRETNSELLKLARIQRLEDRFYKLLEIVREKSNQIEKQFAEKDGPSRVTKAFVALSKVDTAADLDKFLWLDVEADLNDMLNESGFPELVAAVQTAVEMASFGGNDLQNQKGQMLDLLSTAYPNRVAAIFGLGLVRSEILRRKLDRELFFAAVRAKQVTEPSDQWWDLLHLARHKYRGFEEFH